MAEMYSHKELFGGWIRELLQVQDVQIVSSQKTGDCMYDAWFIRAGQSQIVVVVGRHLDSRSHSSS